jgi:hypothetical protein
MRYSWPSLFKIVSYELGRVSNNSAQWTYIPSNMLNQTREKLFSHVQQRVHVCKRHVKLATTLSANVPSHLVGAIPCKLRRVRKIYIFVSKVAPDFKNTEKVSNLSRHIILSSPFEATNYQHFEIKLGCNPSMVRTIVASIKILASNRNPASMRCSNW